MKKTALIFSLTVLSLSAGAQTIYDALRYSENNYEGTARTLAMGNAFTALGGDLGSISINPAGSAVANYGQVTITPGIFISSNTAKGTTLSDGTTPGLGDRINNHKTKFNVPNFGVTVNFDMNRSRGLKNITLGFIGNATNRYNQRVQAAGLNSSTTLSGSLAYLAEANGLDYDQLLSDGAYDSLPWSSVVAAQSGIISNLTTDPSRFVGAAEMVTTTTDNSGNTHTDIHVPGTLDQMYQREHSGYKYDYVINLGFNFSDIVYFGANFGITSLRFDESTFFQETALDPEDFPNTFTVTEDGNSTDVDTYFQRLRQQSYYSARGTGIYGKFGIIVTPIPSLRLGAAIQTPTATTITERWGMSGSTTYSDSRFSASAESPEGEYTYTLVSPLRANFGVAYTLGSLGLISVDYELCNYSGMKFREREFASGEFDYQNADIKDWMGTGHNIRAGVEFKPLPSLAIRAGYSLNMSGEKAEIDGKKDYVWKMENGAKTLSHSGSFGLGYSSKGSFFADAACSLTKYGNEYIIPYSDYIFDEQNNVAAYTPEILNKRLMWKVLLTIGFRF